VVWFLNYKFNKLNNLDKSIRIVFHLT